MQSKLNLTFLVFVYSLEAKKSNIINRSSIEFRYMLLLIASMKDSNSLSVISYKHMYLESIVYMCNSLMIDANPIVSLKILLFTLLNSKSWYKLFNKKTMLLSFINSGNTFKAIFKNSTFPSTSTQGLLSTLLCPWGTP